jgi:hypothetical protein
MIHQLDLLKSVPVCGPQFDLDREQAMRAIIKHAGCRFFEQAKVFVIEYLRVHGEASGEDITDACLTAGIRPHDERAFGPVYMSLARRGLIGKVGTTPRRKGHGCSGGNIWRLRK